MRPCLVPGSLSSKMSLLTGNSKRFPPSIISGTTGTIKDTRNLTDKGVVTKMVRKLIDFFDQFEEVPFAYSEKIIRMPRRTDFRDFFEFIFRQLDENYQLDMRAVEDEVPKLLSALGYPYPIKKSTMATLGAQYSWPLLLGALDWMIELVYMEKDIKDESLDDELAYSYFVTCYKKQMEYPEHPMVAADFTDEIKAYRDVLPTETDDINSELDELKTRRLNNEKVLLQIEDDLAKDQDDIRKIEMEIGDLHIDVSKLVEHNDAVVVQLARLDENMKSRADVAEKLNGALNTMLEENQRKEMQIALQKMSGD